MSYLPHHSVVHPKKPEKVRVVFDCAARYRGTDLTNKLVGVLLRFREEPFDLMADIEAMYHQIKVHPNDVDALRFLWYPDSDLSRDPEEFHMSVHLFGGVWSASCANFGLLRTARDNSSEFHSSVSSTVTRNFYVDDCLKSVKSQDGFNLTKWICNSRAVLEKIPQSDRAKEVKDLGLSHDVLPVERALGVHWNVERDEFVFKIQVKDKPLTRHGLLSIVSSIYDPLGFTAPFVLSAKIVLQDLCRRKMNWDDTIPSDCLPSVQRWLEELPALGQFSVGRCYKPEKFGKIASIQIHHFSDASELAYGTVSYLRLTSEDGRVCCSFLLSKSRLAPLKALSIPRLELNAATLAVKLDCMFRKELELLITSSVFWTDSTSVLRYIRNDDKRFHTFVSNRLTVIHDGSSVGQWRRVDSKRNPSDVTTRGLSAKALLSDEKWKRGPEFLWLGESSWPKFPASLKRSSQDDLEIKEHKRVYSVQLKNFAQPDDKVFAYYSSWYKLRRSVAYLLHYKTWLLNKVRSKFGQPIAQVPSAKVTLTEMKNAER